MVETFVGRWRRKEAACGYADVGTEFVGFGTAVLPTEAAPFLTFDKASQPAPVWEVFGGPRDWSPADRERLAAYRVIGTDGAGNPICIKNGSGAIWLLNHEDRFRTRQFVNSSFGQLAECLLAYMGERQSDRFRSSVRAVDPAALAEQSFWWHEAAGLDTEADSDGAASGGSA